MRDLANLPSLLQSFFTTRLMTQRKASPHTIASYRDTFRYFSLLRNGYAGLPLSWSWRIWMPLWSTRFWKIWKTAGAMAPEAGTCV